MKQIEIFEKTLDECPQFWKKFLYYLRESHGNGFFNYKREVIAQVVNEELIRFNAVFHWREKGEVVLDFNSDEDFTDLIRFEVVMSVKVQIRTINDPLYKVARWIREIRGIPSFIIGDDVISEELGVEIVYNINRFPTHYIFKTEEDYTAFLLRWS